MDNAPAREDGGGDSHKQGEFTHFFVTMVLFENVTT